MTASSPLTARTPFPRPPRKKSRADIGMKNVLKEVEVLRDQMEPHRIAALLLREASEVLGAVPETHGGLEAEWQGFRDAPGYPHLQAAARAYLELSPEDRLKILPKLTDIGGIRRYGV